MSKYRRHTTMALLVTAVLLIAITSNGQNITSAVGLVGFLSILAVGTYDLEHTYILVVILFFTVTIFILNGLSAGYYIPAIVVATLPYYKKISTISKIKDKMSSRITELSLRRKELEKNLKGFHNEFEIMQEERKRYIKLYEISKEIENILHPDEVAGKALELISDYPIEGASFYREDGSLVHTVSDDRQKDEGYGDYTSAEKSPVEYDLHEFKLKTGKKERGLIKIKGELTESIKEDMRVIVEQISLVYEKSILYSKVEKLSRVDGLTGLYRRNYFMLRLEEEIKRAGREKYEISVIMTDIDKFKKYNDTHGHLMGDGVLADVAEIIMDNIYESDFVGRYGGEEFVIYMLRASVEKALEKMEQIREIVSKKTPVTISAGISYYPGHGEKLKEIIEAADKALYISKEKGRDRVTVFKKD